jgi:two-component system, sensor histidine kinase PdtaS
MKQVLIGLCLLVTHNAICQNKKLADSLVNYLETHDILNDSLLFEVNQRLAFNHPNAAWALRYANDAHTIARRMNNPLNRGRSLEMIGVNNRLLGNTEAAFRASYAALRLYDSLNSFKRRASLHLQIGEHLMEDGDYNTAIGHMKKSISMFDSLHDSFRKARALINLGETYRLSKNVKEAITSFREALRLNDSLADNTIEAFALGNLGLAYKQQGDAQTAMKNLDRSVELLTALGDTQSICIYSAEAGSLLIDHGQISLGEKRLTGALHLARTGNLKKEIRDINKLLSDHYAKTKQFARAFSYQREFQIYQDSLVNADNIRKTQQIMSNYEIEKKSLELDNLSMRYQLAEATVAQKKKELWYSIIVIALLGIAVVFVHRNYMNKRRANILLNEKNSMITMQIEQKELLHKEIYHRVKNNLQLISSIMSLQSQDSNNEQVSTAIAAGRSRVDALTIIHQNLFNEEHQMRINLRDYLGKLTENLKFTYHDQIDSLDLHSYNSEVNADDAIPIGLIVNEAICNAVKYKQDHRPKITVELQKTPNGNNLVIKDNGPGFTKDNTPGFGTKLITTLARQLKATLNISNDTSGTTILLEMNVDIKTV